MICSILFNNSNDVLCPYMLFAYCISLDVSCCPHSFPWLLPFSQFSRSQQGTGVGRDRHLNALPIPFIHFSPLCSAAVWLSMTNR